MINNITISDIARAREDIRKAKEISEIILISNDPELNYYAATQLAINKKEHMQVIIDSENPLYNYKCIKHCIKTDSLTIDEKKYFITKLSKQVLNSNNEKLIKELTQFLKYNKPDGTKSHIGNNSKRRSKRRI